ncbi:MAG TPA: peptidylprolyl isomerase [Acidimicrobiia bacterium]
MKKLPGLLLAIALVVAACGGGTGALAATVNGTNITVGDVESLIHLEEGTIPKAQFAEFLGFQIQWAVVEQSVLDEYGIEVTEEEVLAEADRIFEEFSAEDETREEFTASRGVTETFLQEVARQGLLDTQVTDLLTQDAEAPPQDEIDAAMDDAILQATEVCVSHILLGELANLTGEELETARIAAEADAQDVLDRLEAGEDFGEIASEVSTDTASAVNGGDLGCLSPAQYVEEFRDASLTAPVGEVLGSPVETMFGFHVMLVTERTAPADDVLPTEDEVIESLTAQAVSAEIQEWLQGKLEAATVTVEERFGTWEATPSPRVVAPAE